MYALIKLKPASHKNEIAETTFKKTKLYSSGLATSCKSIRKLLSTFILNPKKTFYKAKR